MKDKNTSQIQIRVDRQSWSFLKTIYEDKVDKVISYLIEQKAKELRHELNSKLDEIDKEILAKKLISDL